MLGNTSVLNTIKRSYAVVAKPQLIAEWNYNRFINTTVDNVPSEDTNGYDVLLMPIKSIVNPFRPTSGINYIRAYSSTGITGPVTPNYTPASDIPGTTRSYVASENVKYKYWTSPTASLSDNTFATTVMPTVIYDALVSCNKIYVCFELGEARPVNYSIQISTNGTTWSTIASNLTFNSDGVVQIYRQGDGSWSTTVNRLNHIAIKGIRVVVSSINVPNRHFDLIELSARREDDLSNYLINYEVDMDLSDTSFITPLGVASSNIAKISLDNSTKIFNDSNSASPYAGLIDSNVKFTLDLLINASSYGGSTAEAVRQFTMYSDGSWQGQSEMTVEVACKDSSKYLQELKPNAMLYRDISFGEFVWRLCDSVGFNRYNYERLTSEQQTLIKYIWTDPEKSVWEQLAPAAQSLQTAIYFDEFDYLQIKTKEAAYNTSQSVDYVFNYAKNGNDLPDIIDIEEKNVFEANKVVVKYKPTKISDYNNGFPKMEIVWEPDDSVVLRSAPLIENLQTNSTYFKLTGDQAATWQYSGIVQIEGEFISYEGKGYYYYNLSKVWTHEYLKSEDDKKRVDSNTHPDYKWKSQFSGFFLIKERGLWNTTNESHLVDNAGYFARWGDWRSATKYTWGGGFIHTKSDSIITMATNSGFTTNHLYVATRGNIVDATCHHYGTRLRFQYDGYTHGYGGIVINNGNNDVGYYIELAKTAALGTTGRQYQHELNIYAIYSNQTTRRFGPDGTRGIPIAIDSGIWYDLDVYFSTVGSTHNISVSVNGQVRMSVTVPVGQTVPTTGRFGMFVRGFTRCDFDYLYGLEYDEPTVFDAEGWFDKVKGGWVSGQWDREHVYGWRTNYKLYRGVRVKYQQHYAQRFFDEFGPIVHELREFNVKFTKTPVVHSNIYFSNDSQVICPSYSGNAFGSKFLLANTSRNNAIVNGEDSLTFGADNTVDQKLMIYGRDVVQEDDKDYTISDDNSILRRGEISVTIDSAWIQSESAAKTIGDWIIKNWSSGADEVQLVIFGNPLVQICDLVAINYQNLNMLESTHKYFVVSKSSSFNKGLETTLTLRRAKI